jgi:hypothetical protein
MAEDLEVDVDARPDLGQDAALHDRGLLAEWFMRLRLDQELDRSHRAGHLLSIVLLAPVGETGVSEAVICAAGAAVSRSARRADLVGWLDRDTIFVLLPDGDENGSREAAGRWTKQIWLKTMHFGAGKWEAAVLTNAAAHQTVDEVLAAARSGLRASILAARRR